MYVISKSKKVIPFLFCILTIVGCNGDKTEPEYLALAKVAIDNNETSRAVINLKNVLSINPKNMEGRYLLGKSYLRLGLWLSAEKELGLAYRDDYEPSLVIPLLAKAYYHLGDVKGLGTLVVKIDLLPQETQTALKTFTGMTYIKEDFVEKGLNYLYEVVEAQSASKYTELSKAWKHGMNRKFNDALAVIDSLLLSEPNFPEAIEYKAYLLFKEQKMALSAEFFAKYLAIHPQAHELRMMYSIALVYAEQYVEAEKQVDALLKMMPKSSKLNEIKAQTRFAANDYKHAKEYAELALRNNKNLILAKIVAGISAYQLKQLEVAYVHLNSVSGNLSYQHPAKKILNAIKLQSGYENELFNDLSQASNSQIDVDTLEFSATELFKMGRTKEAGLLLNKAATIEPKNSDVLYQQGLFKLFNNDDSALSFFEKSVEINPDLEQATTLLLLEKLKVKDYEGAFQVVNDLIEQNTELALTYQGVIYTQKGDVAKAKEAFQQVLKLNNTNTSAMFKLAQALEIEGDITSAIAQYQNVINNKLDFPLAVYSLYKISANDKYKKIVQRYFQQLAQNKNSEPLAHVYLASFYIAHGEYTTASVTLDKALKDSPTSPNLLILNGKVQVHLKEYDAALSTFDSLLDANPETTMLHVAKANIFVMKGDIKNAISAQKKAIDLAPSSIVLASGLLALYVKNKDLVAASNVIEKLKLSGQSNITIERYSGQIDFLRGNYKKSALTLEKVIQELNTADVALELATSFQRLNRTSDALKVINRYKSTKDAVISLDLLLKQAELLTKVNEPNKALEIYNSILSKSDRHFAMLNNIAMIYFEEKQYDEALKFAKEAYTKSSNYPAIQNTYGLALLGVKDYSAAERHLKQAYTGNPKNENYKVHYAKALLANGHIEDAKTLALIVDKRSLNALSIAMYKDLTNELKL